MNCWICGEPATVTRPYFDHRWIETEPVKNRRCYCSKCFKIITDREKKERALYIKLKKREMFRRACTILEDQHVNMYEIKEAIEVVGDFIEDNPDKIDSSYEALAAIVLIHNRIHVKMQYKVGRYQVDFLLPDLLTVLEIDGERHKHKKDYDNTRDKEIVKTLGSHWNVVRISTDYLDKDAMKLPKAIDKVLDYRATEHVNWRAL